MESCSKESSKVEAVVFEASVELEDTDRSVDDEALVDSVEDTGSEVVETVVEDVASVGVETVEDSAEL